MSKRFGSELRKLLSELDQDRKFTPAEVLSKISDIRTGSGKSHADAIEATLRRPAIVKKFVEAYVRSGSGKTVFYFKGVMPVVMTVERYMLLQRTIRNAQKGLKKYYKARAVQTA